MNLTPFTTPVTDMITALVGVIPDLATAGLVIAGGLVAIRVGVRFVKGLAR